MHAFEHIGGTGRLLVPDNLRTGVSKADRYEPVLNPAYAVLTCDDSMRKHFADLDR